MSAQECPRVPKSAMVSPAETLQGPPSSGQPWPWCSHRVANPPRGQGCLPLLWGSRFRLTRPSAIPQLADSPGRQMLHAIVNPIDYYRRCFRSHNGVVRVQMVPGLSPQQVLINDPALLQELMGRDNGRGLSAPGHLNDLMEQVVGEHSIFLLEPAPHRARRRLLTPPPSMASASRPTAP